MHTASSCVRKGGKNMRTPVSEVYNCECMEYMKTVPDKFFDLAIVDPPYFDVPNKLGYYGSYVSSSGVKRDGYECIHWAVPGRDYFEELKRVSKNQIVWGCNYFDYIFSPGRIIWNKVNGSSSFSDCEIAACSLIDSVRMFTYMWNGMVQGKSIKEGHIMQGNKKLNENRIHPTQKPTALYLWLLKNYAKPGNKILDSHMGSQSSRIAAYKLGFDYYGCELDEYYFRKGCERFNKECKGQILTPSGKILKQGSLFE